MTTQALTQTASQTATQIAVQLVTRRAAQGASATQHCLVRIGVSVVYTCNHLQGIVSIFYAHLTIAQTLVIVAGTTARRPPVVLSPSAGSHLCPKCGTTKISGKLSCCARGGSWFKKCGDPGDASIDHTWFEGVQACKSKFLLASLRVAARAHRREHRLVDVNVFRK